MESAKKLAEVPLTTRLLSVFFVLFLVVVSLCLITVDPAYAWLEADATWPGDPLDCPACHSESFPFATRYGPHGGFTTTSSKCSICHTVHDASPTGVKLLPKATTRDNCMVCHDGTGGNGVYGAIAARGLTVGAAHRIDTTSVIPGGDAATGGSRTATFTGENGYLSCDDCHSVHGADVVDPFSGERVRFHASDRGWLTDWSSTKLLRQKPVSSDTSTTVYGSDWCLGCHAGRSSAIAPVMNHAVDSSATTSSPFYYDHVAIVTTDTSLETTYGTMGLLGSLPNAIWHNRGFVMPTPRTSQQEGHAPICQQCHEDSRDVGSPGSVTHAEIYRYGDGKTAGDPATDSPLFQNFPHETQNEYMLVETGDDLCMNCHDTSALP